MKKFIVTAILILGVTPMLIAQIAYGIKGGLNFSTNGDIIYTSTSIIEKDLIKSKSDNGFHIGAFLTTKGPVYFRPELMYTQTKSKYNGEYLKINKLDAPLLLGFKLFGPLSFFVGPSVQYLLDSDLKEIQLGEAKNDITVGLNTGLAVKLKKIGFDIRYEKGFSSNEVALLNTESIGSVDTRPEQIILSLSLKI